MAYAAAVTGVLMSGTQFVNVLPTVSTVAHADDESSQHSYMLTVKVTVRNEVKNVNVTVQSSTPTMSKDDFVKQLSEKGLAVDPSTLTLQNGQVDLTKANVSATLNDESYSIEFTIGDVAKDLKSSSLLMSKAQVINFYESNFDVKIDKDSLSDPVLLKDLFNQIKIETPNTLTLPNGKQIKYYSVDGTISKQDYINQLNAAGYQTPDLSSYTSNTLTFDQIQNINLTQSTTTTTTINTSTQQSNEDSTSHSTESQSSTSSSSASQSSASSSSASQSSASSSSVSQSSASSSSASQSSVSSSSVSQSSTSSSSVSQSSESNSSTSNATVPEKTISHHLDKHNQSTTDHKVKSLPQTGDQTRQSAMIAVGLAAVIMGSALALMSLKKRNK